MKRAALTVLVLAAVGVVLAQAPPPVRDPPVPPQSEWPQVDPANPASVDGWTRAQGLPARQLGLGGRLWGPAIEEAPVREPETWLGWLPVGSAFTAAPPAGLAYDWEGQPQDLMIRVYGDRWLDKATYKVQAAAKMPDDKGWCWCLDVHRATVIRLPAATKVRPAARFRFVVDYGR